MKIAGFRGGTLLTWILFLGASTMQNYAVLQTYRRACCLHFQGDLISGLYILHCMPKYR